ncbi:alpha/beta hydrolase [Segetibacter sp. 3557_3]|uniref:alpha/beta hydrolase n=1 Tax=Segetibacter sp. 3557_3 TaxID=2547429 RepID=UPI0010588A9F|nr:alpha/beta hydrolase [Segetibacter sp. 3557_3]TDH20638.1 alpha/beta hydrolase [Segetibacter sp. 3557_3]
MRYIKWLLLAAAAMTGVYLFGPQPSDPLYRKALPDVPSGSQQLEQYVQQLETARKIKPGNNAMIVWNDSLRQKTPFAIVYLHGFSASREEGNPVHMNIARKFGCNLYLSRLAEHGIDTVDAMINLTADGLWESAKQALAIGRQLGEKVIIMGTSTGGSLALQLAATYPDIAALVLMSPNIEINNAKAGILNDPWGLEIARQVTGSEYNYAKNNTPEYKKYWYYQYRLESAVQLQEYLETAMTKATFAAVRQPVLSLYYYRDAEHQDPVVKVSAIRQMMKLLGTPANQRRALSIPTAGHHVLGSHIVSQDTPAVEKATGDFLVEVVGMMPSTRASQPGPGLPLQP